MKPMNFPERKNIRRIKALKGLRCSNYSGVERDIFNTEQNILDNARQIRTKKNRSVK